MHRSDYVLRGPVRRSQAHRTAQLLGDSTPAQEQHKIAFHCSTRRQGCRKIPHLLPNLQSIFCLTSVAAEKTSQISSAHQSPEVEAAPNWSFPSKSPCPPLVLQSTHPPSPHRSSLSTVTRSTRTIEEAKGGKMRQPRIERGAHRWQRWILPLNH